VDGDHVGRLEDELLHEGVDSDFGGPRGVHPVGQFQHYVKLGREGAQHTFKDGSRHSLDLQQQASLIISSATREQSGGQRPLIGLKITKKALDFATFTIGWWQVHWGKAAALCKVTSAL